MGLRYLPYAFTETGVAQLSGVLNSEKAIQINNQIISVFIKMRSMLMDNLTLRLDIEEIKKKLQNQDKTIELVFSYLDELMEKQKSPDPGEGKVIHRMTLYEITVVRLSGFRLLCGGNRIMTESNKIL